MVVGGPVAVTAISWGVTATPEQAHANAIAMYGIFNQLVAEKREALDDDLTSTLIRARDVDDSVLDETDLVGTLILMLSAGE